MSLYTCTTTIQKHASGPLFWLLGTYLCINSHRENQKMYHIYSVVVRNHSPADRIPCGVPTLYYRPVRIAWFWPSHSHILDSSCAIQVAGDGPNGSSLGFGLGGRKALNPTQWICRTVNIQGRPRAARAAKNQTQWDFIPLLLFLFANAKWQLSASLSNTMDRSQNLQKSKKPQNFNLWKYLDFWFQYWRCFSGESIIGKFIS